MAREGKPPSETAPLIAGAAQKGQPQPGHRAPPVSRSPVSPPCQPLAAWLLIVAGGALVSETGRRSWQERRPARRNHRRAAGSDNEGGPRSTLGGRACLPAARRARRRGHRRSADQRRTAAHDPHRGPVGRCRRLDAGEPAVARDIVAADRVEVRSSPAARRALTTSAERPASRAARSRRVLLALPAIPLVGAWRSRQPRHYAPHSERAADTSTHNRYPARATSHHPRETDRPRVDTARTLERLVTAHPQPVTGRGVAAQSAPATERDRPGDARMTRSELAEVRRLLSVEQRVLESPSWPTASLSALAASRRIATC